MKIKYYRNIIFCKTPLKSHFRFGDILQLFPCYYEGAPQNKGGNGTYPIIIEYWVDEEKNPEVPDEFASIKNIASSTTNQVNRLNKLIRLLTAVSNHHILSFMDTTIRWGMPLPDNELTPEEEEIYNLQSSQRYMSLFSYPGMSKDMEIDGFSAPRHPLSKLVSHKLYYTHDPVDSHEKEITLPDSIENILKAYLGLDEKSQKIADTVAHLIANGVKLREDMKSISFLTFVSAIETLVNYEYRKAKDQIVFDCTDCQTMKSSPIHCPKCNRPIWGVKAKFRSFLQTYVANSDAAVSKFNRIYNLRSEMVHNGMLLLGDEQMDWSKSQKKDNQWQLHIETMQLARLSLVNWLILGPDRSTGKL